MVKRVCILHLGNTRSKEELKTFDENSWKKTQDAKHIRDSKPNSASSKYNEVCRKLADRPSSDYGYHSSRYTSFTSVPKLPKIISEPQKLVKRPLLRSDISVPLKQESSYRYAYPVTGQDG